ncbi:hypothetical protein CGZ94_20285 [Enemella evansiae]|uniref:Uncharacterized protein n=1 Tax=Enemella evansiae TaxID=2016499 RepID=A0A255FYU5_9ACTN|nr:hypothetical protein [Enemella evansiae]OYO08835.1 hypothetical protein CGZ94_20285 [Enemella evansiae]
MSGTDADRERLTENMMALDDGLNRIAKKYDGSVRFDYEDPETFGGGHFVFYPEDDTLSRFTIEEQYTGTDWSDDERLPTSWTWTAQRRVRHPDGGSVWGIEREGEARSQDFRTVLIEAEKWTRRTQNRTAENPQFGISRNQRREPPGPRL